MAARIGRLAGLLLLMGALALGIFGTGCDGTGGPTTGSGGGEGKPMARFEFLSWVEGTNAQGQWNVSGQLRNYGQTRANEVTLMAQLVGSGGRILQTVYSSVTSTYGSTTLYPNDIGNFSGQSQINRNDIVQVNRLIRWKEGDQVYTTGL